MRCECLGSIWSDWGCLWNWAVFNQTFDRLIKSLINWFISWLTYYGYMLYIACKLLMFCTYIIHVLVQSLLHALSVRVLHSVRAVQNYLHQPSPNFPFYRRKIRICRLTCKSDLDGIGMFFWYWIIIMFIITFSTEVLKSTEMYLWQNLNPEKSSIPRIRFRIAWLL